MKIKMISCEMAGIRGHKKSHPEISGQLICAEGGIRTHTGLLPHGPEPCASTNFTTSAKQVVKIMAQQEKVKLFLGTKRGILWDIMLSLTSKIPGACHLNNFIFKNQDTGLTNVPGARC